MNTTLHQPAADSGRLAHVVRKHRTTVFRKPPAPHTISAYETVRQSLAGRMREGAPIILDSCCGTARSTSILAELHPDALVVGIDRSPVRLKAAPDLPRNAVVLRADCADFWELCKRDGLLFDEHAVYYPNPYPKSEHLLRRWHAHPAFPTLVRITRRLELRSNMEWYVRECTEALRLYEIEAHAEEFRPERMMTAFEKKYAEAGQCLWRVRCGIPSAVREKLSLPHSPSSV